MCPLHHSGFLSAREMFQIMWILFNLEANTYVYKTINWVSKELAHRDNDAGGKEDHYCDSAVKPEHKVVNPYLTYDFTCRRGNSSMYINCTLGPRKCLSKLTTAPFISPFCCNTLYICYSLCCRSWCNA